MLDGIQMAGKTGTTKAYRDAWFVGFTGNFVCAASGTAMTTIRRPTR